MWIQHVTNWQSVSRLTRAAARVALIWRLCSLMKWNVNLLSIIPQTLQVTLHVVISSLHRRWRPTAAARCVCVWVLQPCQNEGRADARYCESKRKVSLCLENQRQQKRREKTILKKVETEVNNELRFLPLTYSGSQAIILFKLEMFSILSFTHFDVKSS